MNGRVVEEVQCDNLQITVFSLSFFVSLFQIIECFPGTTEQLKQESDNGCFVVENLQEKG